MKNKQRKSKATFVPGRIFKHDDAALMVGVSEVTINNKPAPNEVYFLIENGEGIPETLATFTPGKAVEIAEALLRFARIAKR